MNVNRCLHVAAAATIAILVAVGCSNDSSESGDASDAAPVEDVTADEDYYDELALREAIDDARAEGYREGKRDGYDDGYDEGYQVGYDDGYSEGFDEGCRDLGETLIRNGALDWYRCAGY